MTEFVNIRDACAKSIMKIKALSKTLNETTSPGDLQANQMLLTEKWTKYSECHDKVLAVTGPKEIESQIELGTQIEAVYTSALGKILQHQEKLKKKNPIAPPVQSNTDAINVQLPTIKLPTFKGSYNEWNHFKDVFTSLIMENRKLSNVQKLHYLKSSVTGEADSLLHSYSITDANLDIAWAALENRFENRKSLTHSYLCGIFDAPAIKNNSASELRQLIDTITANLNQLKALDYPTDNWDALITFIAVRKLDFETRKNWEFQLTTNEFPNFDQLKTFIYQRCNSVEMIGEISTSQPVHQKKRCSRPFVSHASSKTTFACWVCNDKNHRIHKCPTFSSWDIPHRIRYIEEKQHCSNCRNGHTLNICKSLFRCLICKQNHHTLLHADNQSPTEIGIPENLSVQPTIQSIASNYVSLKPKSVLLATAIIRVYNAFGTVEKVRALIDQGSQCSFITESLVQRMKLKRQNTSTFITGIGGSTSEQSKHTTSFKFSAIGHHNVKLDCTAVIIKTITSYIPTSTIPFNHHMFHNLDLADPSFHLPGRIEMLLGADIYGLILNDGLKSLNDIGLVAQNTILGWILSGPCSDNNCTSNVTTHVQVNNANINDSLRRFWELEDIITSKRILTEEESACEQHFVKTHIRNGEGRFIVRIPFNENISRLGQSKNGALVRLQQVERRLMKNESIRSEYDKFMLEYKSLGHMRVCKETTNNILDQSYYIPHHHIIKDTSTTTKLRVVFDASKATDSGYSLNDCMMVGPKIQQDILQLLLRWRTYKIGFTADIEKMYRQILINENDTNYQKIVYRFHSKNAIQNSIETFKLQTVTYGTASAPFLAVRCLNQLAIDERHEYARAAEALLNDFYVDDIMSGSDSIEEALDLQYQLINILKAGGFHLRKWASNNLQLLSTIPTNDCESQRIYEIDDNQPIKALGLSWDPTTDEFMFKVN